jgi:arylsulfatase A-like enzyme
MNRRTAIKTALTATLAACAPAKRKPNILFVMTDDHAVPHLGCYGSTLVQTPHMDRLAGEGVLFENAFCTNSLCAPARATILTGAYSHVHHIYGNSEAKDAIERINPEIPTYPQLLQQNGYHTGIVGKWHLSHDPVGFDYWCVLPGQGLYFDPEFIDNGKRHKLTGYCTDITTDLALGFLREAERVTQPWCLVYQHKAPHRPFKPAPRHAKLYAGRDLPYPPTYNDDYATRRVARDAEDMRFDISLAGDYPDLPKDLSPADRKNWLYQRWVKDYLAAIHGVDENLGRVLQHLANARQLENTLIIYTTDNGFFVGDHGWYDKRFMYEPSLRIPLIVRPPGGVAGGRKSPLMAMNVDIAPTILDYAGIEAPSTVQGRSLRPMLEGESPGGWRESIYYAYYEDSWRLAGKGREAMSDPSFQYFTPHRVGPHRGVRDSRYKLIHYHSEGDYWELFDLETDPHELSNVYGQPEHEATTARLKQELQRLREFYGDTA